MNKIKFDNNFKKYFKKIQQKLKKTIYEKLDFFIENQQYPSLRFKKIKKCKNITFEFTINNNYRAAFYKIKGDIIFFWIGSHSDFDKKF